MKKLIILECINIQTEKKEKLSQIIQYGQATGYVSSE